MGRYSVSISGRIRGSAEDLGTRFQVETTKGREEEDDALTFSPPLPLSPSVPLQPPILRRGLQIRYQWSLVVRRWSLRSDPALRSNRRKIETQRTLRQDFPRSEFSSLPRVSESLEADFKLLGRSDPWLQMEGRLDSRRLPVLWAFDELHRFDDAGPWRICDGDGSDWDEHDCCLLPHCELQLCLLSPPSCLLS